MNTRQLSFAVNDLAAGIRFYSAMFANAPAVQAPDHARWTFGAPPFSLTLFARSEPSGGCRAAIRKPAGMVSDP